GEEDAMSWLDEIKAVLPGWYSSERPDDVVGYLQGSKQPSVWLEMAVQRNRHQMMLMGNIEPTKQEWEAAGVMHRGQVQTVSVSDLQGFVILYGGFMLRPWGQIYVGSASPEALQSSLASWK